MSTDCFVPGDNAGRGQSGSLWSLGGGCPWGDIVRDRNRGFVIEDDFEGVPAATTGTVGKWVATAATAGTFGGIAGEGGLAECDSASGTADQGIQIQRHNASILPAANRKIWYEFRGKVIDLVTNAQLFMGLSELDTTIFAAGANTSANHVGFEANAVSIAANPGKLQFEGEKAGARAEVANVKTLAEDTFFKAGFYINGLTDVTIVVDGVINGTKIVTANIPIVAVAPTFACLSEGASDPILTLDWMRCAVLFV